MQAAIFIRQQDNYPKSSIPQLENTLNFRFIAAAALSQKTPRLPVPILHLGSHSRANTRTQITAHMCLCVDTVEVSYLVMLSGLDRLERADPVLHLFPVLSTEDEPTERSDHLEGEAEAC